MGPIYRCHRLASHRGKICTACLEPTFGELDPPAHPRLRDGVQMAIVAK